MASSTTLKELSKAINAYIVHPTASLPEDLIDTIAAYLRRHQKYDDAAADRLQDELFVIFEKHVRGNRSATGAWFGILRRLLPMLQTPERVLQWFDACKTMLVMSELGKGIVDETVAGFMDLITLADEYQDIADGHAVSNPIIDRLLHIWIDRYKAGSVDGGLGVQYAERMIRDALAQFGRKRPKAFFTTLDSYFVKKAHRKAVLRLLCHFIQGQPPHLHTILQTPLFSNLLTCLQQDTSTTVVSAALTGLIMLLPHMPSSLVPHLPPLFNIYARILFWEREKSKANGPTSIDSESGTRWEVCTYVSEVDDLSVPHLSNYYTVLYGLYPINFMDYIRKPERYLRHANASSADEFEIQPSEIRHQSEQFRRCHLLHPNFYTLTIDSEKTNFGRWIKSEAAEVVAECMDLSLTPDSEHLGSQGHSDLVGTSAQAASERHIERDMSHSALLSTSVPTAETWRNARSASVDSAVSQDSSSKRTRQGSDSASSRAILDDVESRNRDSYADSPTFPPQPATSTPQTQLQEMLRSNQVIKTTWTQSLANDSVPSLSLSHQGSTAERRNLAPIVLQPFVNDPMSLTDTTSPPQVAALQQRIFMLQNDLSFERYLKQQHKDHIGDLRRRQVAEAATEAETQNLILLNRNLKSRYEDAKFVEMQVRKESEKSRAMAKKWEGDLTNKLKSFRDESKRTNAELEIIRRERDESKTEVLALRQMVRDAEVKELHWTQDTQSIEMHNAEIDRLKAEIERLTVSERDHQAKELEEQAAIDSATDAENNVERLRQGLSAQQDEAQRASKLLQAQIASLQAKLAEGQEVREGAGGRSHSVDIENDLAASRAKQAELERQHSLLLRKYTALQSSLLDMQSGAGTGPSHVRSSEATGSVGDYKSMSTSPVTVRTRPHRGLSNPEALGAGPTSYNVTPALGWMTSIPASPGSSQQAQPATSTRAESADNGAPPSPDQRFHGRGGVQNRIRKDDKNKAKEDGGTGSATGAKKDKKPSGLRGIRGLV